MPPRRSRFASASVGAQKHIMNTAACSFFAEIAPRRRRHRRPPFAQAGAPSRPCRLPSRMPARRGRTRRPSRSSAGWSPPPTSAGVASGRGRGNTLRGGIVTILAVDTRRRLLTARPQLLQVLDRLGPHATGVPGSMPKPPISCSAIDRPVPNSNRPRGKDVQCADALGHAHRMVERRRQQRDALPEPDPVGVLGGSCQPHLRAHPCARTPRGNGARRPRRA